MLNADSDGSGGQTLSGKFHYFFFFLNPSLSKSYSCPVVLVCIYLFIYMQPLMIYCRYKLVKHRVIYTEILIAPSSGNVEKSINQVGVITECYNIRDR